MVAQDRVDVAVAGDGPDVVPGEVDDGPLLPELVEGGERVDEEIVGEGVEVGRRAPAW